MRLLPLALAALAACANPASEPRGSSSSGGRSFGTTTSGGSTSGGLPSASTGGTTGVACAGAGGVCSSTRCCKGLACSSPLPGKLFTCEPSCQVDRECDAGFYCDEALVSCGDHGPVAGNFGYCHRNCFAQGCSCATDEDCPRGVCRVRGGSGRCVARRSRESCPTAPCPAGCPETTLAESPCPVCACVAAAAPCGFVPDGGSAHPPGLLKLLGTRPAPGRKPRSRGWPSR